MPKKASLLIVDDDEDMLETLSDILQEKGYRTETAKTGEKAIKKAKEHFFSVALIDIKLPDITGIELLRTFRENHPTMMNIIITPHPTRQNAVDALNLGANAYIMKPIDPEKVDRMIRECLANAHALLL
jgi:DNA-binding NtrC family response regulator